MVMGVGGDCDGCGNMKLEMEKNKLKIAFMSFKKNVRHDS